MAKMVLWSAMTGRVLMNGQPAVGAVLVRDYSWHWKGEEGSDRTTTNANGEFSLPAIEGLSLSGGLMPHEPVIEQVMKIEYEGKSYRAWGCFKHGYGHNDENGGKPIDVTCHLDATRARHGEITGICEFN